MQQAVIADQYYIHRYGGLYKCIGLSESTVDNTKWVTYLHVYPFINQLWHRPIEEWTAERFKPISTAELYKIMSSQYIGDYREIVSNNKKASKGK